MTLRLRRGLSLTERQEVRKQARERAFSDAERKVATYGLSLRCERANVGLDDHRLCRGESAPYGVGCLCSCHDNPGVTIEAVTA